uniref:Ig-like domain-containing protein n=1 Tax=Erpetoichthys calabaricus TaxID=27687 RepID=A0A8C4SB73_ERPCA
VFTSSCLVTGSGDSITNIQTDVLGKEMHLVTLSCNYSTSDSTVYLFWYRQYPGQVIQYILSKGARSTDSFMNISPFAKDRFSSATGQDFTELTISHLTLNDSAIYYCALRLTALYFIHTLNKNYQNHRTYGMHLC